MHLLPPRHTTAPCATIARIRACQNPWASLIADRSTRLGRRIYFLGPRVKAFRSRPSLGFALLPPAPASFALPPPLRALWAMSYFSAIHSWSSARREYLCTCALYSFTSLIECG